MEQREIDEGVRKIIGNLMDSYRLMAEITKDPIEVGNAEYLYNAAPHLQKAMLYLADYQISAL